MRTKWAIRMVLHPQPGIAANIADCPTSGDAGGMVCPRHQASRRLMSGSNNAATGTLRALPYFQRSARRQESVHCGFGQGFTELVGAEPAFG